MREGDQSMKGISTCLGMLGVGMFCGIILISVALGSIFPKVNSIARPMVCGNEMLDITQYTAPHTPGSVDTTTKDYCIDPATSSKREVTPLIVLVAGIIYGLIIFVLLLIVWVLSRLFFKKINSSKIAAQGWKMM
jgi:hypothetical protein